MNCVGWLKHPTLCRRKQSIEWCDKLNAEGTKMTHDRNEFHLSSNQNKNIICSKPVANSNVLDL